jgi:hypothetical protein
MRLAFFFHLKRLQQAAGSAIQSICSIFFWVASRTCHKMTARPDRIHSASEMVRSDCNDAAVGIYMAVIK